MGRGGRTICNGVFEDGGKLGLSRRAWDAGEALDLVRKWTFLEDRNDGMQGG